MSTNTRKHVVAPRKGGHPPIPSAKIPARQHGADNGTSTASPVTPVSSVSSVARVSQRKGSDVRLPQDAKRPPKHRYSRYARVARRRRISLLLKIGSAVVAGVAVLAIVYVANTSGASSAQPGVAGQYRFDVASPATGAVAPSFSLPSTTGGTVNLAAYRGKSVLLYFQEGIGCEGCWTQLKDIQSHWSDFKVLGIDAVMTITTNPLDALKQKVADEGITLPVLSDESFTVSHAYNATAYGMMAGSADGHTFILVGPDGRIRWRADYGDYTMYIPISNLIADIKAGEQVGTNGTNGK